jgi:phenylalanyl-tRNA synthetase beta chain
MTAAGLSESMTFAFIERQAALPFCAPGVEPVAIANPLSEKFAVLRPSILPGLVDSCSHNRRRGRKDVRLFETGSRFTDGERRSAALAWYGAGGGTHWSGGVRSVDFFDVKGIVEMLCAALGVPSTEFLASDAPFLVRGRAAAVMSGGQALGLLGQLSPAIAEARGFPSGEELYVAEIDLDAIAARSPAAELRAETLPKYPAIVRDLSILVGEALPAAAVRGTIRSFRSAERTLTDDEVEAAMTSIVGALQQAHGAERR